MSYSQVYIDTIGYIATLFIIICYIPQMYEIFSKKSAKNISIPMYMILVTAQIMWIIFGILLNNIQIILTNVVSGIFSVSILVYTMYSRINENNEVYIDINV
jgi:MtN3 and saliva related transmembrane protein